MAYLNSTLTVSIFIKVGFLFIYTISNGSFATSILFEKIKLAKCETKPFANRFSLFLNIVVVRV